MWEEIILNQLIRRVLLALFLVSSALHASVLINSITVSTVDGYPEEYFPESFNYFGLLCAPLQYHLSDGESRVAGAGWIPLRTETLRHKPLLQTAISHINSRILRTGPRGAAFSSTTLEAQPVQFQMVLVLA